MNKMSEIITAVAPVNIAVIKYWGKRDENLILPLNDSVSATLDTNIMCAKTSVCASLDFTENELWLNGKKDSFTSKRIINCLNKIKEIATEQKSVPADFLTWKVRVCSENNFPTAAGLASSAAGFACLVSALAKLYKINTDISAIARMGSGSACRSVYGGFVQWHAGVETDGSDSIATQIVPSSHWPEMRVLILVVGDTKKHTSSTDGMQLSVKTSAFLKHRVEHCVPKHVASIRKAIQEKDFTTFAELTMKDSNQFHAVCLDTYPPCVYMTDVSFKIVELIHAFNKQSGEVKAAYTFDAGPNACIYLLEKDVPELLSLIKHIFPSSNPETFVKGLSITEVSNPELLCSFSSLRQKEDLIKYVIHTKVGNGPEFINESHLLNGSGEPIQIS
ncbi:diphosphomevalonate decarboxylase [Epargyreus clarus]|uniref:diphosphomevalonate decarboxylase n=1 Tax=Epargyreus clarus TaxID=520877 RepID=UPI003C2AD368